MNEYIRYNSRGKVIPFRSHGGRPYPNAAERRHLIDKAVDWALTAATCGGIVTALLFLMLL